LCLVYRYKYLIAFRLLMALGGCVGMVAARAIVQDLFPPEDTVKVISTLILIMGVAPIIAPTIGGFVNIWLGWRWVFGETHGYLTANYSWN
jgi:DHA1 family bicyclomycin/chloramphenicol resistance-like MFS transporter